MIFYKTSSFGNDFIEIDESELAYPTGRRPLGGLPEPKADRCLLAREICDPHRAVGADGVVFYCTGRKAGVALGDRARDHGFGFQVHNRDGGRAELSGNGMAGLAAVLFQRRLATSPLTLQAAIGKRRIELLGRRGPLFQLRVEIGRPDFSNRRFFPFLDGRSDPYEAGGLKFYPVAVGNPHAVVLCRERLGPGRMAALGKKLASHPMFPRRVNVEFVQAISSEHPPEETAALRRASPQNGTAALRRASPKNGTAALRLASASVFFYERGVGPTLASSTGSAAVFAVLRRLGHVRDRLAVRCAAATIDVSWQGAIFVTNFTRLVCRGEYFG